MQRGYVVLAKAVANGRNLTVESKVRLGDSIPRGCPFLTPLVMQTEEAVYEELVSTLSGAGIHGIVKSLKDVARPFTPEMAMEDPRWQWYA